MRLNTRAIPPVMKKEAKSLKHLGLEWGDDYFWFREKDRPEVLAHLERENEYTKEVLSPVNALRDELFLELKSRIKEEDKGVEVPHGDYYYFERVISGKEHPLYCRRPRSPGSKEEIILDVNELKAQHKYIELAYAIPSPDNRRLAFAADYDGSEKYVLRFKDLQTGQLIEDQIHGVYYGFAWLNDSQSVVYNLLNENLRPVKALRHRLGQSQSEVLYEESDEQFFVGVQKTRSERYVVIHTANPVTSEAHLLSADDVKAKPQIFSPRRPQVEYSVEHAGGETFLVTTNWEAENFRVMRAHWPNLSLDAWEEVIPHRPKVLVSSVDAFQDFFVVHERENALPHLNIHGSGTNFRIPMAESVYHCGEAENSEFQTEVYRFEYSSLTTPLSTLEFHWKSRELKVLKEKEIPGYNKNDYVTERLWATGHDGARIPLSIFHRKDRKKFGPVYLYGYGSYRMNIPPTFRRDFLSLADRGFMLAIAHIRGGSDLGRSWYENGKKLHKKNTFKDFISCAEHLIQEGYTDNQNLVICGGSAGGMLIGATVNMKPELFKAAVAHVPFVDVVNTMLDSSLPLTTIEYEEWGNPNNPEFFDYIRSYSPYDNVRAQSYPHLLVTAGLNDPRVTYWEPAKWVAKLRELKRDGHLVLFHTNMGAGHGGDSGRFEHLKEVAREYAFILGIFDGSLQS